MSLERAASPDDSSRDTNFDVYPRFFILRLYFACFVGFGCGVIFSMSLNNNVLPSAKTPVKENITQFEQKFDTNIISNEHEWNSNIPAKFNNALHTNFWIETVTLYPPKTGVNRRGHQAAYVPYGQWQAVDDKWLEDNNFQDKRYNMDETAIKKAQHLTEEQMFVDNLDVVYDFGENDNGTCTSYSKHGKQDCLHFVADTTSLHNRTTFLVNVPPPYKNTKFILSFVMDWHMTMNSFLEISPFDANDVPSLLF